MSQQALPDRSRGGPQDTDELAPKVIASRVFRVRGVPRDWDIDQLQDFLAQQEVFQPQDNSPGPDVRSLADDAGTRWKVATVTLHGIIPTTTGNQWTIPLPRSEVANRSSRSSRQLRLTFDEEFHGITTLFSPPSEDHKLDVLAIPGLGGHAFASFKERGGEYMWLLDALPYDLTQDDDRPIARIMVYGYDLRIPQSNSMQNLEDLAASFHSSLLALAGTNIKPILVIAHSLGGLIVKQALVSLSRSESKDDQLLLGAVYGLVFFGVPHGGMDITSLIPMVGDQPNRFLVESIGHINSQILSTQRREFHAALGGKGDSEVFCFYETLQSPTAQQDEYGHWTMNGPPAFLVTKASATHCRYWEDGPEHICPISRTHSEMVKFMEHDAEYEKVIQRLTRLARRAVQRGPRLSTMSPQPTRTAQEGVGPHFLVPYACNHNFVGRSDILERLKDQLGHRQQSKWHLRVALYGLGGIGKTQIALAYVHWLQEEFPDVSVFWVHAVNPERFRESYASIAQNCRIPGHDDPKTDVLPLVKRWLEKASGRWLMVIVNADDTQLASGPEGFSRQIPECAQGSVLVTTRNKEAGSRLTKGGRLIEVKKMDDSESKELLEKMLEEDRIDLDLSMLSSRLEYLPLALVQAAAFIVEKSISVSKYLELLDKSDQDLVDLLSKDFETVGGDSEDPRAVTETWILSFDQIQRQNALAGELLALMGLLDRHAIPLEFLSSYVDQSGQDTWGVRLIEALGVLKAFSFVVEKDDSFDIHRLVQLVTRKWLVEKGRIKHFAGQALLVVSRCFPFGNYENWVMCRKYLPHVYAVLGLEGTGSRDERTGKADLLDCTAAYLYFQEDWEGAEKLQSEAVELREEVLGPEHTLTLTSVANLASTYRHQGRWKEAERLEVQVMETPKTKLGGDHPDTLTSMANLASTYRSQGRWEEAEKLDVQVMEIRKSKLGADHPDTLTSMANLASTYGDQGRWEEAEKLEVQVMVMSKTKLGADHPDTLTSMANLASTLWNQGRWKEAEKLEVQVMETRNTKLGADHPLTLASMANLASTYRSQGRYVEAEKLQAKELEMSAKKLGEKHPDTLISMMNLALIWKDMGRRDDAIGLVQQCLQLRQQVLGPSHVDTVSTLSRLKAWHEEGAKPPL